MRDLKERFEVFQINLVTALWVDKETGVEYLRLADGDLRPLFNSEGKPNINKQFKDDLL
ncbi:xylan 1,4-beta-xylosidase [Streptococcus cuniculi]|uniref:Xylan 1,4-beta-xylosidase n=1 Tax=Streptococcus cuniculi TaxID=1432788 RepID=A0A4Y9JD82_9STRE|nr:xylan 1,4-beta-xylosidase [Streptococcus cuniculi]TFU98138.1 xylan 1,4-beta-xylosidase [Streptococcus cuniculi]